MTGDMLMPFALVATLAAALLAMAHIARVDMKTFEIDFAACALLALTGLAAAVVTWNGGNRFGAITDALIAGSVCAAATALVWYVKRSCLGRGDIVLVGTMGAVAGTAFVPHVMTLFLVLTAATSAVYSRRRDKPLFKSAFPAALPGMAALAPVFAWRHMAGFMTLWDGTANPALALAPPALIAGGIGLTAGCILGLSGENRNPRWSDPWDEAQRAGWRRSRR